MRARFTRLTRPWLVVIAAGAMIIGTTARGQLPRRSPFESERQAAITPNDLPLEYVGYIRTAAGLEFRLRDRPRKTAAFVRMNERVPDFDAVARSFDPESGTLTVEHLGRTFTLPEPKAKVRSAPPPPPQLNRNGPHFAPRSSASNMPRAVTDVVVLHPTPAQEDDRLKAIAAEIKRRREDRERAARSAK